MLAEVYVTLANASQHSHGCVMIYSLYKRINVIVILTRIAMSLAPNWRNCAYVRAIAPLLRLLGAIALFLRQVALVAPT